MSSEARANILARLRGTRPPFPDLPSAPEAPLPVARLSDDELRDPAARLARFTAEVERLTGKVYIANDAEAAIETVLQLVREENAAAALVWNDLPLHGVFEALVAAGITLHGPQLSGDARREVYAAVDAIPVGITGADYAFAATGTLVLATANDRGRLPSLLPPTHIALLPKERLLPRLEDWAKQHGVEMLDSARSVTFVTGPSRTGDIEMQIILGVHGPKQIRIVVW
ncbi:MAG: lactate utilization protein [Anaerolineae bacterium]